MIFPPSIQFIARFAAMRPRSIGFIVAAAVVPAVSLFKAQGKLTPTTAKAGFAIAAAPAATVVSPVTSSATFQGWIGAPVPPISRNLFYINLEEFPRAKVMPVNSPGASAGASEPGHDGFPDAQAKSPGIRSEEIDELESDSPAADRFAREAARLHLQSVLTGPTPRAMVDGQLLQEGDVVANFRVLRIEPRGITLEREGIKLEVLFKNDLSR